MVQTAHARRTAEPPQAESAAGDLRRREILAAASSVFRRLGYAATGMREIAAELDMTAGNLYYYFRGKEELLAYCQEATLDTLLGEAERIRDADFGVAEKLRRLVVAHAVCLNETLPGSLAHLEIEALPAARRAPLLRKRKRYERILVGLVQSGQQSGELRAGDARLAALAILGALNWSVKWFSPGGGESAATVGGRFADLFLEGLLERR
jgi:AcrR family transcriptional regulator